MGLLRLVMGLLHQVMGLFPEKKIMRFFGCAINKGSVRLPVKAPLRFNHQRSEPKVASRKELSDYEPLETKPMPGLQLDDALVLAAPVGRDKKVSEMWILHSGAPFHVTGSLKSLEDLEPLEAPKDLMLPSGESLPIAGRGSVVAKGLKIPNVYYAPGLSVNIISVRQLVRDHKLRVTFFQDRCCMMDTRSSKVVGFGGIYNHNEFVLDYLLIEQNHASLATGTLEHDAPWEQYSMDFLARYYRSSSSDGEYSEIHISVSKKIYAHIAAHPYSRSLFYMDSGAWRHVTPFKDLLQAYMERDNPMFPHDLRHRQLVCADGNTLAVAGMGNIDTGAIRLEDVLHVPGLAANLVSVRFLTKQFNQQLQGHGQAAVTFSEDHFVVHIFCGAMQSQLGNGTLVGDDIYLLNALERPCSARDPQIIWKPKDIAWVH